MSTMIMDLCSYTRLGLTGYLTSRGIKKQEIVEVNSAADLQKHFIRRVARRWCF